MTLTLTLRSAPAARVWAPALVPRRLQGLSAPEVAALTVRCGRETLAVGELFEVSGTADEQLVLRGDLRWVDGIGMGMDERRGAGGRAVWPSPGRADERRRDRGARGAGDWAGAEMAGGVLRISGEAGARLGAAYTGARAGMTGGEIVVSGDAGQEAGAGMRRGLVAVGGRTGSGAGLRMLAGTVIALGGIGAEAGIGNKRGSLVSGRALDPLPSYAFATRFRPPALGLQLRRAARAGPGRRRRAAARDLGAVVGRPHRARPGGDPDL